LAHRTSHFAISAWSFLSETGVLAIVLMWPLLTPRTWSNSRTTGSDSPQSTHGWPIRYSRTWRVFS